MRMLPGKQVQRFRSLELSERLERSIKSDKSLRQKNSEFDLDFISNALQTLIAVLEAIQL